MWRKHKAGLVDGRATGDGQTVASPRVLALPPRATNLYRGPGLIGLSVGCIL